MSSTGNADCYTAPNSRNASLSDDGRYVAFESDSPNLSPADLNKYPDVFVKDSVSGTVTLVNSDSYGKGGGLLAGNPSISADGRYVAFWSGANDIVANDTNNATDIYIKDLATQATTRVSTSTAGVAGNGWSYDNSISDDRTVHRRSEVPRPTWSPTTPTRPTTSSSRTRGPGPSRG